MIQSWGIIGVGLSAFALSSFVPTFRFGMLMLLLAHRRAGGQPAVPAGAAGRPDRPLDRQCPVAAGVAGTRAAYADR